MKKQFSIKKRLKSFTYAGRGVGKFIRREHNAWIHCTVMVLIICAGFFFKISRMEWIGILLCIGLVLAAEAFNTAIERIVDLVSPQHHPLAGDAKDIAAGAVLICAAISVIVGAIIFLPYLF